VEEPESARTGQSDGLPGGSWQQEVLQGVKERSRASQSDSAANSGVGPGINPPKVQLSVGDVRGRTRSVTGFDIELDGTKAQSYHDIKNRRRQPAHLVNIAGFSADSQKPINSLIVTLKCPQTLPAIQEIKHRISPDSVITLLQNGMGVYDELCEKVWPDTSRRPQFILGSTTHGAAPPPNARAKAWRLQTKAGAVSNHGTVLNKAAVHHGMGDIKLSVVPDPRGEVDFGSRLFPSTDSPVSPTLPLPSLSIHESASPSPLERTLSALLSLNDLSPTILPISQMHHQLLLKLVVNAAINPITAILGVRNGDLIGSSPVHRMMVALASESSRVILSYLTSLHHDTTSSSLVASDLGRSAAPARVSVDVQAMFQPSALQAQIYHVCSLTAANSSSMLVDVQAGRQTEIDYINGYLVGLGQRMNIPTPVNEMLMLMLKAKGVSCK